MPSLTLGLCSHDDFIAHAEFILMFVHVILHVPLLLYYVVYQ